MSELRGPDDIQIGVVQDLRAYDALTDHLDSPKAIYAGHPKRPQDWPVGVIVTPVYDGSRHMGAGVSRTYRVQVMILVTKSWYDSQNWPSLSMQRIMSRIADRMDRANGMPNHRPEGADGGTELETQDGERMALTADWRIEHAQAFE